jgi:hypothetical protein
MPGRRNHLRIRLSTLALLLGWCSALFARSTERDSVVVDGNRVQYLAEVDVDSTLQETAFGGEDWWLGLGWDVRVGAHASPQFISTSELAANRPLIYLEHQRDLASIRARVGVFLAYSQPWSFSEDEVSEYAKGWIWSVGPSSSAPLQQVVLTPDSLAFERDTVMAPLAPSHALRLGALWEGPQRAGWWPRASISAEVLRPKSWALFETGDPETWPAVTSGDTFREEKWWTSRFRLEAGGVMDLGKEVTLRRSASQFRACLYWVPGGVFGLSVALLASPTRR